ncbi:InlB B-repeat-containing protein [Fibrobacter sp.]|uniref:InlB B-repeat-containing protein n=1 Tax=Fibrobacter sp. TaxID=35828 RepID=UPI003891108C
MKKIPSFSTFFMSILMVLFAASATWADAVSLAEDGDDGSLYVNLPTTGTNTLEIGTGVTSFKVYDDGGKNGNYTLSASLDGSLVMTAPEGYVLQVEGTITSHYYYNASMTVYDGDASGEPLLSSFGSSDWGVPRDVPMRSSSGRTMTIRFRNSAINYAYEGLDLTVTLASASIAHEITFENQGQGGNISTAETDVLAGETVTLNIQPLTGYLMSGISVAEQNGRALKFTGGEWYSNDPLVFTMPYADVTVTPTYTNDLTADGGLYINMPATGTTNAQIPGNVQSFKVYDDGGRTGSHKAGADGYLVLTAPEGYVFRLSGTIQSADASLSVYDGAAYASNLKKMIGPDNGYSDTDVGDVFGSSRIMTLYFKSNGYSYSGFDLTLSLGEYVDYAIATASSVGNGSVEIAENAKPGDVVSLTANPQDGNVFSGVRVVDENGNVVETTKDGNTATFVMPFAEVTVTPYFAGSTVSYDNAGCLDNGMYFRVECSSQTCTISQGAFVPGDDDYRCWSELAAKVEEELGRNWSTIMLGSDLYLGGYDSGSDACVMSDFSALYTKEFEGYGHTVYGFCHITADSSGFLQADVNSISSVAFVDAYVRGDSAGVLGSSQKGEVTWSSVTVNNATVVGNTVGALAGHLNNSDYGYASRLSNVTITNSTIIAKEVVATASVQAGVVAGMGRVGGYGATITISHNTVSADASIASSTVVSLGGVVGELVSGRESLPNTFRISDITISNASSATEVNIGGFAGLFVEDYSTSSQTLERFGFEGSISGGTNVGGIFGKVNLPSNSLTIKNTYSRGSISGSDDALKGYIVGSLSANSKVVYNNYHVGSDVIVQGIGNGYNANSWKSGDEDVFGNVRNASGALATDGAMGHYMHSDDMYYYLDYFAYSTEQEGGGEDPVVVRLVGVVRNGIADEDDMKTDMFAALMNKNPVVQDGETPNADEHNVWTRADGLNDKFPTFADDEHLPNHVVSIDWDGSWGLNSTQMSTLGFERWNAYFFDDDYGYYQAIYGYTDATQHVSSGLVNKLNALVSAVEMSSGAEAGSLMLVDGTGRDVTSIANVAFSSDQPLTIKGVQNISIAYNYCTGQTSCTPFESQTDKTFIFMSPKVNTISSGDDGSYQLLPLVVDLGGTDEVPDATQLRLSVKLYDENDEEIELPASWTYHSQIWLVSEISQFIRGLDNAVSKIELNYQSGSSENLDVYVSNGPTIDAYGVDADGESVRVFSSPNTNYYVTIPSAMGVRAYDFEQKVGYELEGTYTATYEYYDGTYELDEVHEPIYESTEDHAFGSVANLLQKMLSNVRLHLSVNNLTATDTVNLNNVRTALALAKQEVSTEYGPSGNLRVAANYTPINYTVNFDLKLPAEIADNSVLFFGNGWNNPKSNVTVEAGNLPKVYTTTCPAFGGWSPVDDGSVPGTYVLNESFLNSAVVDADYNTTAYGTWNSDNCTTPHTLDFSYWASVDDEDLAAFPGYVVLKQVLGEGDTIAHPMVTTYDGGGYVSHYTTLPEVDDTLTFIVSTAIERGFKISGIELQRDFKQGVSENSSIALNAPEQGDTTLTINTSMLNSAGFNISFDYERFLVGFKRPTDNDAVGVTSVDYYVADEYTGENWPDVKNYGLGDADLDMPKLYALDGCVGWSKATTYDGEHPVYRQFDQSVAQDYESEMVLYPVYFTPDDNPNLCGDAPEGAFLIKATVNNPDALTRLELRQIIGVTGDDDVADTIKHVMVQNEQDPTQFVLSVPKVSLSQAVAENYVPFTFEIHAVPAEGYATYSESYYQLSSQEIGSVKIPYTDGILTTEGHQVSFYVDLISADYTVALDTTGWEHIAVSVNASTTTNYRYELYALDKDLDLPASYVVGESAQKLPVLYAASLEGSPKTYVVSGWTFYEERANCLEGNAKDEDTFCMGVMESELNEVFPTFSADLVVAALAAEAAGKIAIEDKTIKLKPVWKVAPTGNFPGYQRIKIGCPEENAIDGCGENDHPMTISLSQTFSMAGEQITLTHSSDSVIAFPWTGYFDEITMDVAFQANPGYEVNSIKLEFNDSEIGEYNSAESKMVLQTRLLTENTRIVPDDMSFIDYTVTFDISSFKDSTVVLGKSWYDRVDAETGSLTMNVGPAREFPKVYVFNNGYIFNEAFWANDVKTESDFDEPYELDNWRSNFIVSSLMHTTQKPQFNSELLGYLIEDNPTATALTIYPFAGEIDDNRGYYRNYITVDLPNLPHYDTDYHGNVVLKQTWKDLTFKQRTSLDTPTDAGSMLTWKTPASFLGDDDTLEFVLEYEPDPGYSMEIDPYSIADVENGKYLDEDGWGYDSTTKRLKMPMSYSMYLTVRYTQLHYNVDFAMPSDAEVFVANKLVNGDYVIDWFGSMRDITVDDVKAPVVYNAEGCRISWKVDESDRIESEPTASIKYELAYMTSTEKMDGFVNTLVPDVERSDYLCDGSENYFTQFLNVEGEGTIKLLQKLGKAPESEDDPAQLVVTHSFSPNDGNFYMHVPAAYNDNGNGDTVLTGVKFIVQVEPAEGYVLDKLTYETSKNGNYIIAELEDGDSLNIMENLVFNAKFVNLAPIYVTYDLSLSSAEDSANTYLPTSAVTAGSVELESNADTVAFWKPYRTDKCFAGWSTTSADRFTTGIDSIYQVLDADHFGDFSTNSDNPTKLFAIWQECTLPEPTVVLKNGSEHTTVTLYQMFGEDSLPHEITTEGISLVGDEFVFHMDESKSKAKIGYRIAEDAEYMFTYTVAGSDESVSADRDVDHDIWYVRTEDIEGVPTYAIDIATEAVGYNFVLKVEDNDVFYSSAYSSTWTPMADDFGKSLPGNIYRAGQKLSGWSFGNSTEAFQNFDDDFVNAYNDYVEQVTRHEELEGPVTLYAVWEENYETPSISMYLSSEAAAAGKLSLAQVVDGDTVVIDVPGALEIPAVEGLAFAVNYTADSAHSVAAAEKPITLMGDFGVVAQIDNGEMVTIDETYLNLSSIEVRVTPTTDEYEFVFDINVDDDAVVYYGTNWISTATYSMAENGHRFPTSAYQQSNCLAGFYFEPMEPLPAGYTMTMPDVKFYTEIDSEFVADYKKLGRPLDTLYAVWYQPGEKCQQQFVMVGTTNSATEGTFTLTNAGKAYTVPAAEDESSLGIPVADDLEFDVLFTAEDTYDDYGTNDISIKMGKITESHTNGDAYIFTRNAELIADPTLKMTEFELAFAENADGATLFYGENWFAGKAYDISDAEASLKFPTSLYRTDKCLEGFAFEDSDPTVTYNELSEDFVTRFKAEDYSSPLTLYAVWGDCSEPRATYTITAANDTTEGKFVLTNSFGDSINNEYEFDNLSSLVVPAEEDLKFKVTFTENAAFDYTGKVDVYDAANTETALARVNDGESYIFTGSAETQQLHAVVELKTKTFVLKVEDDHVFYPSDFAGFEWTPTSYGDTLPTNVYAVGFKVVGWSVGTVSGAHAKFDNAFVEAYKQSLESSETPEESDTLYAAWDSDDETGTYTIYFDSDEAGSLTLKNIATGVENEFQVGGGLEAPAKENLVFSVNFVADNEHTIKNGRPVKLVDVNGTIIDSIANGGTFELTQTTHIAVETSEDVYHFAFNANAATGDTVFYGTDWFSEKDYDFTGDRNFYFPTSAYQTGKCLAGFAFDAAGTGDSFKELNEDFIVAYRAIEGEKPSTLYAVWTTPEMDSDCDPQVYTVKTNNTAAEGAFTLVNAGNSYSVSGEEMAVPYAADLAFTVQFTAGHAYHLLYDDDIRVMDEYDNIKSYLTNGAEFQFYANTILNAKVYLNSKGLVLAANADTVFYGRDYNPDLFNMQEDESLPIEIYRTNAVLRGWSFKKNIAEGDPILTIWNDKFINAYKKHVESRETFDTPDTLYAVWAPSSNRETVMVSVENKASEGSVKLTNVSYGYSEEFFVTGGSSIVIPKEDDLEFEVDFISESDKVEYTYINVVSPNGTINETFWMGQTRTFSEDTRLKASGDIGSLEVVLDVNAGGADVFYGRDFEFRWWGSSYGDELPKGAYRSDAKLVGWSFKKNATASEAYKEIDDRFVEEYETYKQNLDKVYEQRMKEFEAYKSSLSPAELAKLDQYAFEEYQMKFFEDVYPVLYAVWDTKATVPTHTLVSNSLKQGTLTIVQQVSDSTFAYVVGKDGLEIPTAPDDEIIATGHFEPNPSWLLMGKRPLVWASASGADTTENDFYGNLNEMPKSLTFSVIAKYIGFHLVFNVTSKDSLFLGDDWKSEGDFIATAEETMLPAMVYNSDRCLAGWSVKPDGKTSYTVMGDALADELYATYPNLDDTTKVNLYARFTDSLELCAGELTRVAIEQDKGSVMLVENTGSGEAVHKFNDKGTMLIPMDIVSLEWTVRSAPDSSYELGSVSITRNEKVMSILHEGEHLPGSLEGALLTAVFEKSNKTPIQIVDTSFVQSGNAIRLSFKASDFEVTRGVSARVQLIDMATDSVVVDSLLGDSVAMGYTDEVVLRAKRTGNYKVALVLEDSLEVAEYEREFSVVNEIASIAADSWQMLSIAAVDTSKIDTNDQIFYWWDEHGTGEFWQYKRFSVGDSVVSTRGAWYSSLKGSPLVLRKDVDDDGKDIVWDLDSVSTGWNLVANPHGWAVDLYSNNPDKLKDVDEESEVAFWRYNAETGGYDSVLTMQPYEAVWVQVSKRTTWNISAKPVFAQESDTVDVDSTKVGDPENPVLLKRVLAKTATKERWTLQAVLSDKNGKRDVWNILGAGPNPFNAEEPPESMGDHVNLSIVDGKHAFAKSIKPFSDDMEWTVSISASTNRIGYLSLVGIDGVKAYGYRVYVTVDGNTTEMQEGVPLKVYLKETAKTATVRVAPANRVVAESSLKGLRMARLGGKLQVSFDATGLAGKSARVDIMDMKGHVMATANARAVEGTNALLLDAPKSGLYMLRVRAGSQQQATKIMVK